MYVRTPFFPQEDSDCGPAALASFLAAQGIDATAGGLSSRMRPLPGSGAVSLQLLWAAREFGADAVCGAGSLEGIERSLRGGDPVVVLLDNPPGTAAARHFAVVTGLIPRGGAVILHGRDTPDIRMPRETFLRRWERAGRWALATSRSRCVADETIQAPPAMGGQEGRGGW